MPQKIVRSPNNPNGVVSVGRLDVDTTGIMLFTDDGALNNFMSTHGRKVYVAEVEGVMGDEAAKSLLEGVTIKIPDPHKGNKKYEVDYHTRADAVEVISRGVRRNVSQIRIVISEGKYHQIKSMLAAVGHPVLNLTRTQFGPLRLGNLGPGEWRYLTAEEIRVLLAMRHNEEYKAARFAANISVLRPRAAGDRLKFGNGDTLQFKFANGTTMHNYADDSFASCRQV